jgi:hypothetical protein
MPDGQLGVGFKGSIGWSPMISMLHATLAGLTGW